MGIFDTSKPRFISHRGFPVFAPENSLPSFYYAGLLGQWAIETDLHVTKDGEIICHHNYTIGDAKISEMTYQEISNLTIEKGSRIDCFSQKELKIPHLSEYLSICRRFGSVPFIELKTDDTEYIIQKIRQNGFSDDEFIASSIELSRLEEARRCSPNLFIHWIFAEESGLSKLKELKNAGFSWAISNPFDCDEEKISAAHQMGLKICLRAADDLKNLKRMQELGLDYFPTNKMHGKL